MTEQRNPAVYNCTWWPGAASWECGVWWARAANTLSNDDPVSWNGDTDPKIRYTDGVDFSRADQANYLFTDLHVKGKGKGYIFPGYQKRKDMNSAVDNTLKGVCLDADPFKPSANDCTLPQQ